MLEKLLASVRQFGTFKAIKLALRARFRFLIFSQKFKIFYLAEITSVKASIQRQIKSIEVMAYQGESPKVVIGRELLSNETLFLRRQDGQVLGYALTQDGGKYQLGYALISRYHLM